MTTATTPTHPAQLAADAAVYTAEVPSEQLNSALAPYVSALPQAVLREYAVQRLADDVRAIRRAEVRRAEEEARRRAEDEARRDRDAETGAEDAPEPESSDESPAPDPEPSEEERVAERARKRAEREAEKARREAQREAASAQARQDVSTLVGAIRRRYEIEWTADLLRREVALDTSGRTVVLGEMTWDEHETRMEMLTHTVYRTAETLAIHAQAVEEGRGSGYANLNELLAAR